jgi:phage replication-related protein YjqB (UPF0714/DUF867 family)
MIAHPQAQEQLHVAGPVGLLALHGGGIEPGTEEMARFVAGQTGASLYVYAGRLPWGNLRLHRPSHRNPEIPPLLQRFLDHVCMAVSIHGHGRSPERVYLGGLNEVLIRRLADMARAALARYEWVSEPSAIPPQLRGRHPRNTVNLPRDGGVQLELPRPLRRTCAGAKPTGDALVLAGVLSRFVEEAAEIYDRSRDVDVRGLPSPEVA